MDNSQSKILPLVSILITSYNRAKWIGQAIESAMAQDYPNLEIIVSDDASTDNTHEVISKYVSDPRVKYTRQEKNIGMIANFNKTFFELAKGQYVTQLGSDDFLMNPQFITKAVDIIRNHDNIALVFGKTNFIDQDNNPINIDHIKKEGYDLGFLEGTSAFLDFADNPYTYYTSGAVVYSMKHLKENNIFFEGRVTADIELNLQLMLHGNVGFINEQIYTIRQHTSNASSSFKNLKELEFSYLDLIRVIYKKAMPVFNKKAELRKWYKKSIGRNLETCIYMVIGKKDNKLASQFHRMIIKKYRTEYFNLLTKQPKFLFKLILNK